MPVTLQRHETRCVITIEGVASLETAALLKKLLLEWLETGKDLELDLTHAEELDIPIMQLLWSAWREAASRGRAITGRASAAAMGAFNDAGFAQAPGFPVSGETHG
jgi:hypothetical protein